MNSKLKELNVEFLFQAILKLETIEECYKFFEDLCTVPELRALSQRFLVAKMLDDHIVYSDIVAKTGASTATISRVNRSLNYGNDGYRIVFERLEKDWASYNTFAGFYDELTGDISYPHAGVLRPRHSENFIPARDSAEFMACGCGSRSQSGLRAWGTTWWAPTPPSRCSRRRCSKRRSRCTAKTLSGRSRPIPASQSCCFSVSRCRSWTCTGRWTPRCAPGQPQPCHRPAGGAAHL